MNIISLNVQGGKSISKIIQFISKNKGKVDAFAFQEVFSGPSTQLSSGARANTYELLEKTLNEFNGFFCSSQKNYDFGGPTSVKVQFGVATFVRNKIRASPSHLFIYGEKNQKIKGDKKSLPRALLSIHLPDEKIKIVNFHGISIPTEKKDSLDRVRQSRKIARYLKKSAKEGLFFCADMNVNPNTKSIDIILKKLENSTNYEFIKKIKTTRPHKKEFVDYILVNSKIRIKELKVIKAKVSDHYPVYAKASLL